MKTCKAHFCDYPVFSHGYCKNHQMYRTDSKKPKPLKHSKDIKGNRPRIKKVSIKASYRPTGELKLFLEIYEKRKNNWVSSLSGKPLTHRNGFLFINQFAHLLAKGKYSKFRLNKDNIFTITAEEHRLLDFGTERTREQYAREHHCDWNIIYRKIETLKSEYENTEFI